MPFSPYTINALGFIAIYPKSPEALEIVEALENPAKNIGQALIGLIPIVDLTPEDASTVAFTQNWAKQFTPKPPSEVEK
jgi:hypothetical protein